MGTEEQEPRIIAWDRQAETHVIKPVPAPVCTNHSEQYKYDDYEIEVIKDKCQYPYKNIANREAA